MRSIVRLAVTVALVLASLGAAPPDTSAALGGHWRCAVAGGRPAVRSYFALTGKVAPNVGRREVFGREDTTEPDGAASTSFERIIVNGDGATIAAVEGTGTASNAGTSLHFVGRTYDDKAPVELTYAITGDTMRRVAKGGATTVDDETCTREPETPPVAACAQPNAPARTVKYAEPAPHTRRTPRT